MQRSLCSVYLLFTLAFSCILIPRAASQSFRFKTYDSNVGMPQNFVYCLSQDNNGYLWMGTGEGLVRYNGLEFQNFSTNDSLADNFITALQVAPNGNLWAGHKNGSLSLYRDNHFKPLHIAEAQSPVQEIIPTGDGTVWVLTQNNGIIKMDADGAAPKILKHPALRRKLFYSMAVARDDLLIVGTSEGLFRVGVDNGADTLTFAEHVQEIPMTNITTVLPRRGVAGDFWIGTEDHGFFRYTGASNQTQQIIDNTLCLLFDIEHENIQDIEEEANGNLLLATWGDGVIKLFYDPVKGEFVDSFNFTTANGLNDNFIKDILCDRENNYWFATYGGGVSALINDYMIFYNMTDIGFDNVQVKSVFQTDTTLWLGLEEGLIRTDPFCFIDFEYYDSRLGIPDDEITGFYKTPDGSMFVASANQGLFYREANHLRFKPKRYTRSLPGLKIRDIAGKGNTIYLATYGGFFIIDLETDHIRHLTTENGLPHNNINFVYLDPAGGIWIGPKSSGVSKVNANHIEIHKILQLPVDVYDMVQDDRGHTWMATQGRGVLKYSEDSIEVIDVSQGLAKNFCYSLKMDEQQRLWVAHHPGVSVIDTRAGGEVRSYGFEQNMGNDFHQIWKAPDQTLWLASSEGVINYFPMLDNKNHVPPLFNFTNITISGKQYGAVDRIHLPYPYGDQYQFRFDFIGVSFKNPSQVTYQYKLIKEGDEDEARWTDIGTTSYREYDFLPSGQYELRVKAFNADGFSSEPLSLYFEIEIPFWKMPWFYIVAAALLIYIIYLIIMMRERNLRHQKEQLQREVDHQTVQLREQKAEIERKNRDITDSINYAKRIQKSVLPSRSVLQRTFPESFVFFVPRDIVSGDFYWFHRSARSFLICCADCTGHGVPAAFMSMIGTTLLNDLVKRPGPKSPADILERLDQEIKILLQHDEDSRNNSDGMDIAVIEIEIKSRKVTAASAKRPVYLFMNNELVIYKGNRRSIGDSLVKEKNPFMNIEYACQPGDIIYLFSDGYSDQFGGPRGKKFMTGGVKKLLHEIRHHPMEKQHLLIRNHFFNWKGDLDQVDDVIFMGVRL